MAIQNRRGAYTDLNPAKAVPGELLVVQSGDPNATDGKAVYMTFASGDIKMLATKSDLDTMIAAATDDIVQDLEDTVDGYADRAETAATTAETIISGAEATIAAKGAEQVAAVQAKGEEVLESIPEDYTDLSDDVEALKNTTVIDNAKQLLSDNYVEDKVPYLLRPSGGNGADRAYDTIVGGSVVWNQLFPIKTVNYSYDTYTITSNNDGKFVLTVLSDDVSSTTANVISLGSSCFIEGHKYYLRFSENTNIKFRLKAFGSLTVSSTIYEIPSASYNNVSVIFSNLATGVYELYPQMFDLTQMFGSAIADHLYALETASAGSGIAKLKSWGFFIKDYYAYNAGELMSVGDLQSHDMVGFNVWDEEWELGNISSDSGNNTSSNNRIRSKNYIRVIPNTTYFFKSSSTMGLRFYNANKVFAGYISVSAGSNYVIPDSVNYIRFVAIGRVAYNHDICINISDSEKNGTYEPYVKHSYPLDSSLTLRGIPKLDADNNLYYDGDIYESDGTVTRRYGIVDLGTLTWSTKYTGETNKTLSANLPSYYQRYRQDRFMLSEKLLIQGYVTGVAVLSNPDSKDVGLYSYYQSTDGNGLALYCVLPINDTPSGLFIWETLTSTSETADPYTNLQIVDPSGTEEYVTTSIVPVGHVTKYPENLRAKIEGLPWDLSMIAPIDNGTTATRAYSTGQYFMHDNQLCKAKTSIASGATFTLGTNYEVTTVAAELYSALH